MAEVKRHYSGRLRPGPKPLPGQPDTVEGFLAETWSGWMIKITGRRDKLGGGYILTGELGEVPEWLRIEILDGPAPGNVSSAAEAGPGTLTADEPTNIKET